MPLTLESSDFTSDVSEVGPCKLSLKFQIPQEKVAAKIEEKYRELNQNVNIPGFRRGKVPRKLLEKRYGKTVLEEAKLDLVNACYEKTVEEKKLNPVGDPQIDLDKIELKEDAALAFEATVEVKPSFELKEYTGIEVKRPKVEVSDVDVGAAIDRIRETKANLVPVADGPCQEGDLLVADEELVVDGRSIHKQENVKLPVSDGNTIMGRPAPDLKATVVGAKAGETRSLKVTVPEEHEDASVRGKEGEVRITVCDIKRIQLPEITDAWLKSMDFDTIDEFREEIRRRVKAEKERKADEAVEERIQEELRRRHEFAIPEGLIAANVDRVLGRMHIDLQSAGLPEEKIHEELDKSQDTARTQVATYLRNRYLLEAIADKEKVFVTEDEVEERIGRIAAASRKWPHEVKEQYENEGLLPVLRGKMREEKVLGFLREKAKVEPEA